MESGQPYDTRPAYNGSNMMATRTRRGKSDESSYDRSGMKKVTMLVESRNDY